MVGRTSKAMEKVRSPLASSTFSISARSSGKSNFGCAGEAQLVVVEDFLLGGVDRLLHDVAHDGLAIDALEVSDRHLSGPETLDRTLSFMPVIWASSFSASSAAGRTT